MRQILFLAALLLLCNVAQAQAGDNPLANAAIIQTCSSCGKSVDSKCGCEQKKSCGCEAKKDCGCEKPKCGCEQKKSCGCEAKKDCGCEKAKCGCEQKKSCGCEKAKCGCEQKKSCGCEQKKDCGCVSNEIAYGDGLAFSMVAADSMASSGLAFTMTDMLSEPLDPNCCPGETFCLLDNCTACYTLVCCPDTMRLLCKDKCGKQKCSSCNKCSDSKCGSKEKCGCAKTKCASKCGCS